MKYKAGDKVKVVDELGYYYIKKGEIYTVLEVNDYGNVRINSENKAHFYNKNLFIKHIFTKSDLKDNHIVVDSYSKRLWENIRYKYEYKTDLSHTQIEKYSINEVWEFDKLVWKREEKPVEILNEVEKKYLSDVIRPKEIKTQVEHIRKRENQLHGWQDIVIQFKKMKGILYFPEFNSNTMYKGMEVDKKYTLEELGLE